MENKIDSKENFLQELNKIMTPAELDQFDATIPTEDSVGQMILANELKYIQHILDAAEENKLIEDNAADIRKLDEDMQAKATKYALEIELTQDPEYFTKHGVSDDYIRPVQQIRTMIIKHQAVKDELWKASYRARLVNRLRELKGKVVEARLSQNSTPSA